MIQYGWGGEREIVGATESRFCDNCKNTRTWLICVFERYAELYFVKIARWNHTIAWICPTCERGFEILHEKADQFLTTYVDESAVFLARCAGSHKKRAIKALKRAGFDSHARELENRTQIIESRPSSPLGKPDPSESPKQASTTAKPRISVDEALVRWIAREELSKAFLIAVVTLCAKIAKLDGVVTRDEVVAMHRALKFDNDVITQMSPMFRSAKSSSGTFELYAKAAASRFGIKHSALDELLIIVISVACADGKLIQTEREAIRRIASIFGFAVGHADELIDRYDPSRLSNSFANAGISQAWKTLDLEPGASMEQVKSAYRRKVKEYHPDALRAKGLPEELVRYAEEKVKVLNDAYETLKQHC